MSVLKVTGEKSEKVAQNDEVVAGQVRKMPECELLHETIVLIADARAYDDGDFSDESPFLPIIIAGGRNNIVGTGIQFGSLSAEDVAETYPILLDAELTYREAE